MELSPKDEILFVHKLDSEQFKDKRIKTFLILFLKLQALSSVGRQGSRIIDSACFSSFFIWKVSSG